MRCDAKICFINNRYITGDVNFAKIFGVKLVKAYLKPIGKILSADSVMRIAQVPEMQKVNLQVQTVEEEKFDISVIKIPFGGNLIMLMEIYNVSVSAKTRKYDAEPAISENIVDDFLTNVSLELSQIENNRNRKAVEKIRGTVLYFGGSVLEILHYALANNIDKTKLHCTYADIWSFLAEFSAELSKYGEIELIKNKKENNEYCCVPILRWPLQTLLIALVKYFSENDANGQRIYVRCFKAVNDTMLCISNYKYLRIEKEHWGMNCSNENSNKMINLINLAARAGVLIQHSFDQQSGAQAFLLSLGCDTRARLCEESL